LTTSPLKHISVEGGSIDYPLDWEGGSIDYLPPENTSLWKAVVLTTSPLKHTSMEGGSIDYRLPFE